MRALWSGEIGFGLVTIPAKLYTATKDLTPQFHQLHKECGSRISMVRRCPKCNRDIAYDEIGKGFEVAKGEYALFTKEELAKLDGDDSPGGIDIAEFIDPKEVDLAYIDKSYWVGPGGTNARAFALLRSVLEESGRVGLSKVKIRTRTRLALLRPRGALFSLEMMRFADELVPADDIVIPDGKPSSAKEVALAMHLVEQLTGPFDPTKHPDEYRAAVVSAVDEKVESNDVMRDSGEEEAGSRGARGGAQVIDLADLLMRSLKGAKKPGPAKASLRDRGDGDEQRDEDKGKIAKPGPKKVATKGRESKKRNAG